jgi:hypothetical protein
MPGQVHDFRRVFREGGDFDKILEAGTGPLESVRLARAVANPSAEDFLACIELEALELRFERSIFWVRCDGTSDEIEISGPPEWRAELTADLALKEPWCSVLGCELLSYSYVVKGNSYHDRVQFAFGPADSSLTVQMEFASSKFFVYAVVPAGIA